MSRRVWVIGVMTDRLSTSGIFRPTGLQEEMALISLAARNVPGRVFIFTPSDVNSSRVNGYVFHQHKNGTGYWEMRVIPWPDVVYDLVRLRARDNKYREVRRLLQKATQGRYFNPGFLNKLKVYRLLQEDQRLRYYLPETKWLQGVEVLEELLARHRAVYLKPANGSLGRGIVMVKKTPDGGYLFKTAGGMKGLANTLPGLYKKIRPMLKGRTYLVQQGLDLLLYEGRISDIRVLVQKNGKGEWSITKAYVRVGRKNSIVSNIAQGGVALPMEQVLKTAFPEERTNQIRQEIRDVALLASYVLEKQSGELYGELGVDLGLEKTGRLWLIELNSKPRKATEGSGSPRLVHLSFVKPLRYALYLADRQKGLEQE